MESIEGLDPWVSLAIFLVAAAVVTTAMVVLASKLFRSPYSPYAYVKGLLDQTRPLLISTPLSLNETERRLSETLARFGIPVMMSNRLVGYCKNGRFKIHLHRQFANSASPEITGTIFRSADDDVVRIKGEYRLPAALRGFMTFWFGFLAFWSAIAVPAGVLLLLVGRWNGALLAVFPIVMFAIGVLLLKVLGALSIKDRSQIAATIAEGVGGTVLSS